MTVLSVKFAYYRHESSVQNTLGRRTTLYIRRRQPRCHLQRATPTRLLERVRVPTGGSQASVPLLPRTRWVLPLLVGAGWLAGWWLLALAAWLPAGGSY